MIDLTSLKVIAITEFADIVDRVIMPESNELRIFLREASFIDVWYSPRNNGRYSYHW